MKRVVLSAAAALLMATACGQQVAAPREPEGGSVTPGESPTAGARDTDAAETYVFNRYGDENGFADQRPTNYVATEFTTFSRLTWDEWSAETAHGSGEVSGTWCLDQGCADDPYEVDVELADPVEVDGTAYFSTYTVTDPDGDMPEDAREVMEGADGGRLDVPAEE